MTIFAMFVAFACVAACLERLRRVHGVTRFDLAALAGVLGRTAKRSRLCEMRDALVAEGAGWEGELVSAVLEGRSFTEQSALANECLGDVASDLRWGSRIPRMAAWVACFGPMFAASVARARGPIPLTDIVPVLGWAGAGMIGALAAGREAARVEAEIRKGVDAWVARVLDAANTGTGSEAPKSVGET